MKSIDQLEQEAFRANEGGDWASLLKLSDEGLRGEADRIAFKVFRFNALVGLGNRAEAIRYADSLERADKMGALLMPLARSLFAAGQHQDVISLLDHAPAKRKSAQEGQTLYYRSLGELEGMDEALNRVDQALDKEVQSVGLTSVKADLLSRSNRLDQAMALLENASTVNPELSVQLSEICFKAGQAGRALEVLLTSFDSLPASPRTGIALAQARIASREPENAVGPVASICQDFPKHASLHRFYWALLAEAGLRSEAEEACLCFARSRHKNLEALLAGVGFLGRYGFGSGALLLLDQAVNLAPNALGTLQVEVDLCTRLGLHERALYAADRGISLFPETAAFRVSKFRGLANQRRLEEAVLFAKGEDETLRFGPLLSPLVKAYLSLSRPDLAQQHLHQAAKQRALSPEETVLSIKCCLALDGASATVERIKELTKEELKHPALPGVLSQAVGALSLRSCDLDQLHLDWSQPEAILARSAFLMDQSNHTEAEGLLRGHASALEHLPSYFLLRAKALSGCGEGDKCAALLKTGASSFPRDVKLQAAHWRRSYASGKAAEAREAALSLSRARPSDAAAQTCVVEFLAEIEDWPGCDAVFEQVNEALPDSQELVLLQCSLLVRRNDARAARNLLGRHMEHRTWNSATSQIMAQVDSALGNQLGAIRRLEANLAENPFDNQCRLKLARLLLENGNHVEASECLVKARSSNATTEMTIRSLGAEIAFQRGEGKNAIRGAEQALEIVPSSPGVLSQLSRYRLLSGDVEGAWRDHKRSVDLAAKESITSLRSKKAMRSIQGQILNEFRLLGGEIDLSLCQEDASIPRALRHFRKVVADNPGNLPAAICLLTKLKRSHHGPSRPPAGTTRDRIPRMVFQFWDSPEPPPEIQEIMAENRARNPGYRFELFSASRALTFLRDKGETQAVRGFRLAPNAAAQADIFRLAVLYHEGGIYMDADDGCLTPLDQFICHTDRFVGYYESTLTIGNNFIAVKPRDPIIRFALQEASTAFDGPRGESLWIASGPGVITRSVVAHGTRVDGRLKEGVRIVGLADFRAHIAAHIRLPYKNTNGHWFRAMTSRAAP